MTITTRGPLGPRDWRDGLPSLTGARVRLREMRILDAPAMLASVTNDQVSRFISPPPTTVRGFERFIAWTAGERAAGRYTCFAIVPAGSDEPIALDFDGVTRAIGLFLLASPRLPPNPNRALDLAAAARGRAL